MSYVYTSLKAGEQETESDIVLQKYESVMSIEFDEIPTETLESCRFEFRSCAYGFGSSKDRYLEVSASEVGSLSKPLLKIQ